MEHELTLALSNNFFGLKFFALGFCVELIEPLSFDPIFSIFVFFF